MTREQAKELLPIMQAFAEGKTVEYLNGKKEWIECRNPSFWEDPKHYRIKPKSTYRPFKNKEECWNELLKHQPFGWVKNKRAQYINLLSVGDGKDFNLCFVTYTFIDGTPFGIKEE